jgi:Fe-S oxidoreductase
MDTALRKIVTACPHCFNILKNEYPDLGGSYDVVHHSAFLQALINEGRLKLKEGGSYKGKKITYHDSCYLGGRIMYMRHPGQFFRRWMPILLK